MASQRKSYDIKAIVQYSRMQDYSSYQPSELGTFSISEDGDFINCNKAQIPTLQDYKLPLNLDEGYNGTQGKDKSRETNFPQWEKGLKWIHGSKEGYGSVSSVDIIASRGILKDIGYTNHNRYNNPWKFEACKFKGKVYIRKLDEEDDENEWCIRNSYWGRKFEEYVIQQEKGTKATYRMLKGTIGKKTVLLSAEVDAISNDGKHMEIKTCFANKIGVKVPQAWWQSYLGKVDTLYYGLKTKQGMVYNKPTEISMTDALTKYVKKDAANEMMGFMGDVLNWLYGALPDKDETWVLEYTGGRQIFLRSTGEKFLPNWYLQFIEGKKEEELVKQVEALTLSHPVD